MDKYIVYDMVAQEWGEIVIEREDTAVVRYDSDPWYPVEVPLDRLKRV